MEKTKVFFLVIAIALAPFPWFLPSIAEAQCVVTNPAFPGIQYDKIQNAINAAFPGATIFVTGTCEESNIFIGAGRDGITLNGQPSGATTKATISSEDLPGTPFIDGTILVNGAANVRIRNFIITGNGTADGPNIVDGANVRLFDNIIENSIREGVFVRAASARIFNNTIRNNGADGILVTEGSAVRIGFSSPDDGNVMPNTIQGNAGHGISVTRHSSARILGNTSISGNGGHGIYVHKISHADIASNDISGNSGDGINVTGNSGVNLGSTVFSGLQIPPLAPIFTQPNTTTEPNGGFGIRCSIGGYAHGDLGTLDGTAGATSLDKTCIDEIPKTKNTK